MTVLTRPLPAALKALVAVLFVALFFVGAPAISARAATLVSVTLDVQTKAGAPLSADMNVYAYPVANHAVVGDGIVGDYLAPGRFELDGLDTATKYAFYFDAPASATTAFDQYWGGTTFIEEARYWNYATDGQHISLSLATNSVITGTVTGTAGKKLSGIPVYPWRWDGNGWFRLDWARATTTSTGVYTMRDLEPGTYRIEFAPSNTTGYLSEFSGNATTLPSAASLNVGLGATVSASAALSVGASISGTVQIWGEVNPGDGEVKFASNDVTARAYPVVGGAIDTSVSYASKPTAANGKWVINGLPTGSYKIKVYDTLDPDAPANVDEWLENSDHVTGAKAYPVVAGKTYATGVVTRMDFYTFKPVTSMTLNVTNHSGGVAPDGTEVYIVSNSGEDFSAHFLLTGGTTFFAFLPEGSYDVYVDSPDAADGPYIGTQSITAGSPSTWNIALPSASSFTYSTAASIANSATVAGTTYTVNRGSTSFSDSKVSYSYIWLRDDAPIFGSQSATSSTYVSRGVDVGHKISVIVRADSFGYGPVLSSVVATTSATQGPAPTVVPSDPPAMVGPASPTAGSVLTADVGTWNAPGLTFAYQWYRGGTMIPGATSRAYTVQPADVGSFVSFTLTASRVGYANGADSSDDSVLVGTIAAPKLTKNPMFSSKVVGANLHVTTTGGTWSPVPASIGYQWFADDVLVASTATADCPLTTCTPGSAIDVSIAATRPGYDAGTRTFLVRKGAAAPEVGTAGFAYDSTDGGHPSFDDPTDPAYLTHTLRVSDPAYVYPDDNGGTVARSYLWQRLTGSTWASIASATKVTYVPTTADAGHQLRVRVTTTSTRYATKTEYFTAGTGTLLQDLVTTPASAQIAGTADVGVAKWAAVGSWPVSGVTQAYQWFTCNPASASGCGADPSSNSDWKAIAKATTSAYTPVSPQFLSLRVTGSKTGYASKVVYAEGRQFSGTSSVSYTQTGQAAISGGIVAGQAAVGRQLTGKPGATDRSVGVTRTYQWKVCNGEAGACSDVPGATGLTATPDVDNWLNAYATPWVQFTETVSFNGSPQFVGLSTRYPLVAGINVPIVAPKVTLSGGTYTVASTWNGSVSYQWFDGGTQISTTATAAAPSGTNPVVVVVTVSRPGYQPIALNVVARKGTFPAQPTTITGGTRYGDTLTATNFFVPSWNSGVVPKWQWYSGTSAISGKTAATYVPSTAYVGKSIKARITLSSPFWNTATYYTPAITLGSHIAATGTPVVVSTLPDQAPGAKLTANLTSFPAGMTYAYAWQRSTDGTTWSSAGTASSYTTMVSDIGKFIRVVVIAKKTGWVTSPSIPSAAVTVGYSPDLKLTSPFVLGGAGVVDTTLTASTTWNTTGFALTYSWTRNGVTIPGATGASVTPTASWFGDEVQAHVTATKSGYITVTVHSNEVRVGAGVAPVSAAPTITRDGNELTASAGVWSVAGVTVTYAWFTQGGSTVLGSGPTFTAPGPGSYTVVLTAHRTGYSDGSVTRSVTF